MIYYYLEMHKIDDLGYAKFGALDQTKKEALLKKLQDLKVDEDTIGTIFGSLTTIRDKWADLFSNLGRTLGKNEIQEFKKLFGNKFKNYIGATYDVFQNKSILPSLHTHLQEKQLKELSLYLRVVLKKQEDQ